MILLIMCVWDVEPWSAGENSHGHKTSLNEAEQLEYGLEANVASE